MSTFPVDRPRPWAAGAGRAVLLAALLAPCAGLTAPAGEAPAAREGVHKVVVQVSEGGEDYWRMALTNVITLRKELGPGAAVEVITFGPGIGLLKLESELAERVGEAAHAGVQFYICENTLRAQKLARADMLPEMRYVPAGAVTVVKRQAEGYAYLRP